MPAGRYFAAVVAGMVFAAGAVSAHRLDECLQAARIGVESRHVDVELDLTPGAAVARSILSDIDGNGDGVITTSDQRAYVMRVFEATELEVDGRHLDLHVVGFTFPMNDTLQLGEGTIRLRARAPISQQSPGDHQIVFRNAYRPDVSVYLANALVPQSSAVAVTGQRRDVDQRELTISYQVRAGSTPALSWLVGGLATIVAALLVWPLPSRRRPSSGTSSTFSARS